MKNNRLKLEDKIWRSWGIISNARVINGTESMKLLSDIRLGVDLGVLKNIPVSVLNEIMVDLNNASLQYNIDYRIKCRTTGYYKSRRNKNEASLVNKKGEHYGYF